MPYDICLTLASVGECAQKGLGVIELDLQARILGLHLQLGDLQDHPPCMGYANACVCDECLERELMPARRRVCAFPWEENAA